MLKLIVPPPILLASRIAGRNDPPPMSLVFMTVNTKGVVGVCTAGRASVIVGSDSREFLTRADRMDCAVSYAERLKPASPREMPVTTITRPKKICGPKKADREVGLFFMRRLFNSPAREVLK